MTFYAVAMYATVSNMWAIVVGEESPATKRARFTAVVFVISLIPVQAFLPVLVVEQIGIELALDVRDHVYRHDPGVAAVAVYAGTRRYQEIRPNANSVRDGGNSLG